LLVQFGLKSVESLFESLGIGFSLLLLGLSVLHGSFLILDLLLPGIEFSLSFLGSISGLDGSLLSVFGIFSDLN